LLRILTFITLVFLSSEFANAQKKGDFFIGPLIGINLITSSGDGIDSVNQEFDNLGEIYNSMDGITFSGGISNRQLPILGFFIDYYFLNNIAFYSSFSYSQKGFTINEKSSITIGYDYEANSSIKVNLNYVTLPLLIKYHSKNGIQIFGGISLNYCESDRVISQINETYEVLDTISGNIVSVNTSSNNRDDYADFFNNSHATRLITGYQLGISYRLHRFNFSLRLENNDSFGKIYNTKNNYNQAVQFCTEIIF